MLSCKHATHRAARPVPNRHAPDRFPGLDCPFDRLGRSEASPAWVTGFHAGVVKKLRPNARKAGIEPFIKKASAAPKTKSIISAASHQPAEENRARRSVARANQESTQRRGRHCPQSGSKPGQGGSGAAGE
jgi:hypothetical protein